MSKTYAALALTLLLLACSRSGGSQGASSDVCALIARPNALLGPGATSVAARGVGDGSCRWQSADGRRGGEIIVFSGAHLGGTAQAFVTRTTETWGKMQPDYPLEAVSGVGDEAQVANHLPGYQTQIVFRKGERVVTVQGWSGDAALSGEQLARRMAQAADGALK